MRKLQIFISSTYKDLVPERQNCVQAILDAGHIPAGMELFNASDESQMITIRKWIDESDIYMLLLGKRYGSIEPESQKSYTQLEYEYAISTRKPLFSLVVNNPSGTDDETLLDGYKSFKALVLSKIVKFCDDTKDIKYNLILSIHELETKYGDQLSGWTKGDYQKEIQGLTKENMDLKSQIIQLSKEKNQILEKKEEKFGALSFDELSDVLRKKEILIKKGMFGAKEDTNFSLLYFLEACSSHLSSGVCNRSGVSQDEIFVYVNVASELASYGLAEVKNGPGSALWKTIQLNKDGIRFLQILKKNKNNKE